MEKQGNKVGMIAQNCLGCIPFTDVVTEMPSSRLGMIAADVVRGIPEHSLSASFPLSLFAVPRLSPTSLKTWEGVGYTCGDYRDDPSSLPT